MSYISKMLGVEIRRVHSHADLCPGVRKAKFTGRWSFPNVNSTWIFFDRVTFTPGRYTEENYSTDLMVLKQLGLLTIDDIVAKFGMRALRVVMNAAGCPGACRIGSVQAFPHNEDTMDYFRLQAVHDI